MPYSAGVKTRVLVVEDDGPIADLLSRELERLGYAVLLARNAAQALIHVRIDAPHLMLLDMGLPDIDGSAVLRQVRKDGNDLPIIVVTARDASGDRVDGLRAGADDYVVKPFDMSELGARIEAVLRRSGHGGAAGLMVGSLLLRLETARIERGGVALALTPREFQVLARLMQSAERVVTKPQLLDSIAQAHFDGGDKSIEVYIHRIRSKLIGHGLEIVTVRGFGYLLRPCAESL